MSGQRNTGRGCPSPAALAIGLATVLGTAAPALAAGLPLTPPAFGMVGLGRQQTAVLNAVLTGDVEEGHPGCAVTLSFVDRKGDVFEDRVGNPFRATFVLRGNVAAELRMRAADILGPALLRVPIRGVVTQPPGPLENGDCSGLVVTLEIVGPLGETQVFASLARGPKDPPPPNPDK
jgi:hypothetical protein